MTIQEILKDVPDKQYRWKGTTSLKWKEDFYNFAKDKEFENILELGTNFGWTAYVASFVCENIYTVESDRDNFEEAQKICKDRKNVTHVIGDAYSDITYRGLPEQYDAVIIDCIHTYGHIRRDIKRAIDYKRKDKPIYLIFDDYSHPTATGVRQAIDDFIRENAIFNVTYIGHDTGHVINRNDGTSFQLIGPEGVIIEYDGE